jgi:DNA-binding response OmpR family regulator
MSNLQRPRPLRTKTARRLQSPRTFYGERRMHSAFGTVNGGSDAIIQFGRCRVLPLTRQLMVDGHSKELGTRAFDLLIALASAPSTVVKKARSSLVSGPTP